MMFRYLALLAHSGESSTGVLNRGYRSRHYAAYHRRLGFSSVKCDLQLSVKLKPSNLAIHLW